MAQHLIAYRTGASTLHFLLYITGQSHRGAAFGPHNVTLQTSEFRHGGVIIQSDMSPQWNPGRRIAYLRGDEATHDDDPLIFDDRMDRDLVSLAIEEYNKTNGGFAVKSSPMPDDIFVPLQIVIPPCDRCGGTKKIKTLLLNRYVEDPCPLCGFIDKVNEAIEIQRRRAI